ncbi:MAG: AAA family ATPase, partial [Alphaproteobacteria bacterium]|nr:AAA family ATPase [Alphaproteobacteria bacterium]
MTAVIEKLETNIPGFDYIALGGLPKGRATLVSGTSGSGKTVFAVHFLAAGIEQKGEGGVFVTFEEPPDDIRKNIQGLGWDISGWETGGKWAFVDASLEPETYEAVAGEYDLGALLVRIENAIRKTN